MKKIKTNLIFIPVAAIIALCIFFLSYNLGKSHAFSISNNYYNHCEALLDSINNWDESFMDTVVESDVYYEYELSRENYIK